MRVGPDDSLPRRRCRRIPWRPRAASRPGEGCQWALTKRYHRVGAMAANHPQFLHQDASNGRSRSTSRIRSRPARPGRPSFVGLSRRRSSPSCSTATARARSGSIGPPGWKRQRSQPSDRAITCFGAGFPGIGRTDRPGGATGASAPQFPERRVSGFQPVAAAEPAQADPGQHPDQRQHQRGRQHEGDGPQRRRQPDA